MKKISLPDLLEARVHLGHRTRRWNPRMKPFIYTKKAGVHILDLVMTREYLLKAQKFLVTLHQEGGKILFLGTKKQARDVVEKWAKMSGSFYITHRWPGGLLSNFSEVQKGLEKLRSLKELQKSDEWDSLSTRQRHQVLRKIEKGEKVFGGILGMTELPRALFVVDPRKERNAVKEAVERKIPIVAVIDTDGDPTMIDYPIPANDDASRSLELILELAVSEISSGSKVNKSDKVKEEQVVETKSLAVADSQLPTRGKTALIKAGHTDMAKIAKMSTDDLEAVGGIGKKLAQEIHRMAK